MPTAMSTWTRFGVISAIVAVVASCGRGGDANAVAMGHTTFSPVEASRLTARLDDRGLPEVLIDGVRAVHATWVFWGKEWAYANAEVEARPGDGAEPSGEAGVTAIDGNVANLGLTFTGTVARGNGFTYTLDLNAAQNHPEVIGGGIEFAIDLQKFAGIAPPELLANNEGWVWPTAPGEQIRLEADPPLANVYFERGNPGRIRCFMVADSITAGAQSLTLTLTMPKGAAVRKSEAERFAKPDLNSWLPDPLVWNAWPIDVGASNERPAGNHGRVRAVDGRLQFDDGAPARFWGVNVQAYALFSGTDAEVEQQADRIAALGFNLVRIHHHDSGWVQPNVFGPDGQGGDFSEAMAARIDRWVAALKVRGVYLWLDLHVGRRMGEAELTEAEGRSEVVRGGGSIKGFNYVNPAIEKAMDEFVRTYLTRENTITGIRYADEPAVIAVLLTNENDLTRHFGNLMLADKNNPVHHQLMLETIGPIAKRMGFSREQAMRTWEPGLSKLALAQLEKDFFDRQTAVVRETGYDGLIATSNFWGGMGLDGLVSLTRGGLIDLHSYGEPGELSRDPRSGATWLARIAQARVYGKPLTITEWNIPYPARDRFTTPLHMSAIASLQGWDAPMLYGYLQEPLQTPKRAREWSAWVDPSLMALMPAASVMFRDGHVAHAERTVVFEPEREMVFLSDMTADTTPALRTVFETHAFAVHLPDTAELDFDGPAIDGGADLDTVQVVRDPGFSLIPEGVHAVTSDTGEIRRDWARGTVEIRTPMSQAAMGWIGRTYDANGGGGGGGGNAAGPANPGEINLGDVRLSIETPAATVAVTSLDRTPIKSSTRLLITAVAQAVGGEDAGRKDAVWVAEPVRGTVTIDLGGRGASVKALNGRGEVVREWVVEPGESGLAAIELNGESLWYEITPGS